MSGSTGPAPESKSGVISSFVVILIVLMVGFGLLVSAVQSLDDDHFFDSPATSQ